MRSDNVQDDSHGMDPYAYVGDNPETRNDPTGHCWPLYTIIIGALVGAAINVATAVVTDAVQHKTPSLGEIAQSAAVGAVSGAVAGLSVRARTLAILRRLDPERKVDVLWFLYESKRFDYQGKETKGIVDVSDADMLASRLS